MMSPINIEAAVSRLALRIKNINRHQRPDCASTLSQRHRPPETSKATSRTGRPAQTTPTSRIEDALERRKMPRVQRVGVVGDKKWGLRIFWAWRQRRASLDLRPPHPSEKIANNNHQRAATCGRLWGMRGATEVAPYGSRPNYGGARAPDCRNLLAPSPGSKTTPKKSQTTINWWEATCGVR